MDKAEAEIGRFSFGTAPGEPQWLITVVAQRHSDVRRIQRKFFVGIRQPILVGDDHCWGSVQQGFFFESVFTFPWGGHMWEYL